MATPPPPTDRPPAAGLNSRVTSLNVPGLGIISCGAVASNGMLVVCTESALYAFCSNGLPSLLAGHVTETGFKDGKGSAARFSSLSDIAVDATGNVLVVDSINNALRKVTRNGAVSTLAGNGEKGHVDGVGDAARFYMPQGIVVAVNGSIYVSDSENHCVRHVKQGDWAVSTLAGDGKKEKGYADGVGLNARFNTPRGLALDTEGHLIVADTSNQCIRKVTTDEGRVTTVAGNGKARGGFADGNGAAVRFAGPMGIAVDGNNNIFVTDFFNHRIRMVAGASARVTTLAGRTQPGKVDGTGAFALLSYPRTLAMDEHGRLLVADRNQGCMRVIDASLPPSRQLLAVRLQQEERADRNAHLLLQVRARSTRTHRVL